MTWSPAFSRALDNFLVCTLSSHWLFKVFSFSCLAVTTLVLLLRHSTEKCFNVYLLVHLFYLSMNSLEADIGAYFRSILLEQSCLFDGQ